MKRRVIVLIGATGVFGQRLARLLAKIETIEVVVTSRSLAKAEALARGLRGAAPGARVTPAALDTSDDIDSQLIGLAPFLVIDASGPFQGASYQTAAAALKAGAHWIDIADASGYILGFGGALEALARSEGLAAFAGASTSPALSSAAVAELTQGWARIDTADIAIRPGGNTAMGRSVIEAVLSYAGLPVAAFAEGTGQRVTGWGWPKRVAMPGLGRCWVSAVETADAQLLQKRFNVTSRVTFRFGLNSKIEHVGLVALGWLRAKLGIGSLKPLAAALERVHGGFARFGSDTGGMTVDVTGIGPEGQLAAARWWLVARRGHGPNVPVLAAVALTRKLLTGGVAAGARPASDHLMLSEITDEMQAFKIETGRTLHEAPALSLFERAMGEDQYLCLAPAVRSFHDATAPPVWAGRADIDAGGSLLARSIAKVFGFPPTGRDVPVTVSINRDGGCETWIRNFSGRRFHSRLALRSRGVVECFGPFQIRLGLDPTGCTLTMPVKGWQLGAVPLPGFLAPRSETREYQDREGRFRFDVRISAPVVGLIAHYRGWLQPDTTLAVENMTLKSRDCRKVA